MMVMWRYRNSDGEGVVWDESFMEFDENESYETLEGWSAEATVHGVTHPVGWFEKIEDAFAAVGSFIAEEHRVL